MAGGGVFAGGAFLHFAEAGEVWQGGTFSRPRILFRSTISCNPNLKDWAAADRYSREDMTERVGAFITVVRRVWRVTDSDAVENDDERAHRRYNPIGCQAVFISTVSRIQ